MTIFPSNFSGSYFLKILPKFSLVLIILFTGILSIDCSVAKMKLSRPGAVMWKCTVEVHLPNLHTLTLGVINSS